MWVRSVLASTLQNMAKVVGYMWPCTQLTLPTTITYNACLMRRCSLLALKKQAAVCELPVESASGSKGLGTAVSKKWRPPVWQSTKYWMLQGPQERGNRFFPSWAFKCELIALWCSLREDPPRLGLDSWPKYLR